MTEYSPEEKLTRRITKLKEKWTFLLKEEHFENSEDIDLDNEWESTKHDFYNNYIKDAIYELENEEQELLQQKADDKIKIIMEKEINKLKDSHPEVEWACDNYIWGMAPKMTDWVWYTSFRLTPETEYLDEPRNFNRTGNRIMSGLYKCPMGYCAFPLPDTLWKLVKEDPDFKYWREYPERLIGNYMLDIDLPVQNFEFVDGEWKILEGNMSYPAVAEIVSSPKVRKVKKVVKVVKP